MPIDVSPIEQVAHPEVMLPTQFFGALRGQAALQRGECRLLAAVLEDAVRRFQRYANATDRHGQRMFREVADWIERRDSPTDAAFEFEYVCAVLGLDPDYVREGLQRWAQAGAYRSPSASRTLPPRMPTGVPPDRGKRA